MRQKNNEGTMPVRWETHRGDEWWYADYWCKLDAGFNSAYPGTLSIDKVEFKPGQLSESRIQALLWATQQQFKDNNIELCGGSELVPVLEALQRKGLLEMKPTNSTYSKCVQVIRVSALSSVPEKPSESSTKKPWWRFW